MGGRIITVTTEVEDRTRPKSVMGGFPTVKKEVEWTNPKTDMVVDPAVQKASSQPFTLFKDSDIGRIHTMSQLDKLCPGTSHRPMWTVRLRKNVAVQSWALWNILLLLRRWGYPPIGFVTVGETEPVIIRTEDADAFAVLMPCGLACSPHLKLF